MPFSALQPFDVFRLHDICCDGNDIHAWGKLQRIHALVIVSHAAAMSNTAPLAQFGLERGAYDAEVVSSTLTWSSFSVLHTPRRFVLQGNGTYPALRKETNLEYHYNANNVTEFKASLGHGVLFFRVTGLTLRCAKKLI